jgi:hypothetical protein
MHRGTAEAELAAFAEVVSKMDVEPEDLGNGPAALHDVQGSKANGSLG